MLNERAWAVADIRAFVRAARLARRAQRVATHPIAEIVEDVVRHRGPPSDLSVERLRTATARATARVARWFGGRDTCLIRALVLGALLSPRGAVELTIGFRSQDGDGSPGGHAWLTLDGHGVDPGGSGAGEDFAELLKVAFERRECTGEAP